MTQPDLNHPLRCYRSRDRHRGFTLVEMLIVIAVIIVLLSILIVGLNFASRTAQTANSRALMQSISQALVRFEDDIGYLPPVLGTPNPAAPNDLRTLWEPPGPDQTQADPTLVQRWYSATSLAEYLLGYGNHRQDGFGYVGGESPLFDWDEESPPLGIRHPSPDGVWNASARNGLLTERMGGPSSYGSETTPYQFDQGRVYGPYLELSNERLLGSTDGTLDANNNLRVYFPGDPGYNADHPKVIVDYWGTPVLYFRRTYPSGALAQSYPAGIDYDGNGTPDPVPTLSDVYRLRPYSIKPGAGTDNLAFPDLSPSQDTSTTFKLNAAAFALFSPGPDRRAVPEVRVDPDEINKDNIIEVGP